MSGEKKAELTATRLTAGQRAAVEQLARDLGWTPSQVLRESVDLSLPELEARAAAARAARERRGRRA